MPLNLDFNRLKSTPTNPTIATLNAGTVVESESDETFFLPFNHSSITPPSFTVAGSNLLTSSTTVSTNVANGFASVRVGDVVTVGSGGGTLAGGTTVASIVSTTSIVLSSAPTANSTTANSTTLSFAPPAITPTVLAIRLSYTKNGSVISVQPSLFLYNGSLGGTVGTALNASAVVNLIDSGGNIPSFDLDAFYNTIRVARSA